MTQLPKPIPIIRPTLPDWEEVEALLHQAWATGIVTTGPVTRAFEAAVERKLAVRNAVMVDHGTTALMLSVRAMGLVGEVVIPAFTWTATAAAVVWNGIEPVFADVVPGRLTLDPEAAEAAITPRTSAIMPVNVFGVPPDMDAFEDIGRRREVRLLYDSAQGLGAQYRGRYHGGFGEAECFSLSPTKVVTALEGGIVTTGNDALAAAVRSMRDSGKNETGSDIVRLGLSGRPSEVHAAVALRNFERLDDLVAARHERMKWYRDSLADLPGIAFQQIPDDIITTGNYFVIFVDPAEAAVDCATLQSALMRRRIQSKRYFHPALHLQTAYAHLRDRYDGRLPVAEKASAEGLALPLYSHISRAEVERVVDAVRAALRAGVGAS